MIEGVDFTVSYAPMDVTLSLRISIALSSVEGVIIFVLDMYNAFQNTIVPKPTERVYLI